MKNPFGKKTVVRSSITGEFVPIDEDLKNPDTTEKEQVDTTKTDEIQNGGKPFPDTFEGRIAKLEARVENLVKRNHLLECDR